MEKIVNIHGDVTLIEVNSIPEGAKKIKWYQGFILEKGEGVNIHTIENECEIYEKDGVMYYKEITEPIRIDHKEHGLQTIKTKTGIVKKEIEREYDYETKEARQTLD